jgi:hypothetical protein
MDAATLYMKVNDGRPTLPACGLYRSRVPGALSRTTAYDRIEKGRAVTALTARAYGGSAALTGLGTGLTPEQAARFAGRTPPKHFVGTQQAYERQYSSEGVWAPSDNHQFGASIAKAALLAKLGGARPRSACGGLAQSGGLSPCGG